MKILPPASYSYLNHMQTVCIRIEHPIQQTVDLLLGELGEIASPVVAKGSFKHSIAPPEPRFELDIEGRSGIHNGRYGAVFALRLKIYDKCGIFDFLPESWLSDGEKIEGHLSGSVQQTSFSELLKEA